MPTLHRECYRTLIVNEKIKEMHGLVNASLKSTETWDELSLPASKSYVKMPVSA